VVEPTVPIAASDGTESLTGNELILFKAKRWVAMGKEIATADSRVSGVNAAEVKQFMRVMNLPVGKGSNKEKNFDKIATALEQKEKLDAIMNGSNIEASTGVLNVIRWNPHAVARFANILFANADMLVVSRLLGTRETLQNNEVNIIELFVLSTH